MAYKHYPEAAAYRSGCKVSWRYYETEAQAQECAKIATHNGAEDRSNGFDHGYCSPGNVTAPEHHGFYPGLWEVCCC